MRIITSKERKNAGAIYCSFCRPDKINAIYRREGHWCHESGMACEIHKSDIHEDDGYMTEADHQTWGRL